jgi:membrane protease YdiL (CAAX protease family)
MTEATFNGRRRPYFEITGLRFRIWPILLAAAIMQILLVPARELARFLYTNYLAALLDQTWLFVGCALLFQALGGFAAILVMARVLPRADANLRWPPRRTYVGWAALIGVGMGLTMLVADYGPDLVARTPPDSGYDPSVIGALGWIAVMASTGLAEETIFRGLLVGMLVVLVPGRLRVGRLDLPVAAYVVGALFAVAHYRSFLVDPLHMAIAQQLYAFAWGLIYVMLMERSRSLLAPMVAHGIGNSVEVGIVMALMVAWSG